MNFTLRYSTSNLNQFHLKGGQTTFWVRIRNMNAIITRFPETAELISLERIRSSIKHWRLAIYPPSPTSLQDFKNQLLNNEYDMVLNYRSEYHITATCVKDDKGDEHILFYDQDLIQHFKKASHLSTDATFDSRINLPECSQLLTVLALRGDNVIIFLIFLLSKYASCI